MRDTPLEPLRNPPALISAGFVNKVDNFPEKVRKQGDLTWVRIADWFLYLYRAELIRILDIVAKMFPRSRLGRGTASPCGGDISEPWRDGRPISVPRWLTYLSTITISFLSLISYAQQSSVSGSCSCTCLMTSVTRVDTWRTTRYVRYLDYQVVQGWANLFKLLWLWGENCGNVDFGHDDLGLSCQPCNSNQQHQPWNKTTLEPTFAK